MPNDNEFSLQKITPTPTPTPTPTIILVNYIHHDGIGDFQHFLDLAKALYPLASQAGVVIVPLILCSNQIKETVKKRINELNLNLNPFIFTAEKYCPLLELNGQFSEFVSGKIELQSDLNSALTIFQISTATTTSHKNILLKYCVTNIPIVNISEHFGLRTYSDFALGGMTDPDERDKPGTKKNINDRWMGIDEGVNVNRYGIKLHPALLISKQEALLTFDNLNYVRTLVRKEATQLIEKEEVTDFISRTQIIPAYLQRDTSITKFILYCIEHEKHSDKDILIHINNNEVFSSESSYPIDPEDLSTDCTISTSEHVVRRGKPKILIPRFEYHMINEDIRKYNIGTLEINVNGAVRTINFGPPSATKKTLRILVGFYLADEDYNKLYHVAGPIIGISGDTTLEKALSHDKLPFLQDDKYAFEPEIRALFHACLECLPDMSPQLKLHFSNYFLNSNMRLDYENRRDAILQTDWDEMHKVWPVVMTHLRQHYNIYNHLKNIFYEALLHASAQRGDVALLKTIYINAPEIDVLLPNKTGQTAFELAKTSNNSAYIKEFCKMFPQQQDSSPTKETDFSPTEETHSSSMMNISMMVLGGFIAAAGIAAIAISFTLLHAATLGITGLVMAGVGVSTVLFGVGFFATDNSTSDKDMKKASCLCP